MTSRILFIARVGVVLPQCQLFDCAAHLGDEELEVCTTAWALVWRQMGVACNFFKCRAHCWRLRFRSCDAPVREGMRSTDGIARPADGTAAARVRTRAARYAACGAARRGAASTEGGGAAAGVRHSAPKMRRRGCNSGATTAAAAAALGKKVADPAAGCSARGRARQCRRRARQEVRHEQNRFSIGPFNTRALLSLSVCGQLYLRVCGFMRTKNSTCVWEVEKSENSNKAETVNKH